MARLLPKTKNPGQSPEKRKNLLTSKPLTCYNESIMFG